MSMSSDLRQSPPAKDSQKNISLSMIIFTCPITFEPLKMEGIWIKWLCTVYSVCACYMCDFMAQVQTWAKQQAERIQSTLSALEAEREETQRLLDWISSAEESLNLKEQEPLPEDLELTADLITQHMVIIANNNLFITLNLKKIQFCPHSLSYVISNLYDIRSLH